MRKGVLAMVDEVWTVAVTMERVWIAWILPVIFLVMYESSHMSAFASSPDTLDVGCVLDEEENSSVLERCLRRGQRFVKRYSRRLYRGRQTLADTCSSFSGFRSCLQPLLDRCPTLTDTLNDDWLNVYDVINCSCTGNEECLSHLACFEDQIGGLLGQRCDDYYKFNLQQRTRDKCQFYHENIHCKERLVTSACSDDVGRFAFHFFKMVAPRHPRHGHCASTRNQPPSGFRYSDRCWPGFANHVTSCADRHLEDAARFFHNQNDLVTEGGQDQINSACREYRRYKGCISELSHNCTEGLKLVYDYDGRLRTNIIKLDYICQHQEDYVSHLGCYQDVLANETLKSCDPIWQVLQPMLEDVSAHEFYCKPDKMSSQNLTKSLHDLRICYNDVFMTSCGSRGGDVIHGLMLRAFRDPFYLRYDFKPDCDLHKPQPRIKETDVKYRYRHKKENNVKYGMGRVSSGKSCVRENVPQYLFMLTLLVLITNLKDFHR